MSVEQVRKALERHRRAGQRGPARPAQMAEAVADRSRPGATWSSQAGTGTGKTLGYLVPAIIAGQADDRGHRHQGAAGPARRARTCRSSQEHLGEPFDWAVLKGRSNYVCLQRLRELSARPVTASSNWRRWRPPPRSRSSGSPTWAGTTRTGDLAELDWSPTDAAMAGGQRRQRRVPGRHPLPARPAVLRRRRARTVPRRPT